MNCTLCWRCSKAVKKCPWSKHFKPVPGWSAIPTLVKSTYLDGSILTVKSFVVVKCPQFVADKSEHKVETVENIANRLNISKRTYYRWLEKNIIDKSGKILNTSKEIQHDR